MNLLLNKNNLA